MRRFLFVFVGIFLLFLNFSALVSAKSPIYFFYGQSCPHCLTVEKFFEANKFYDEYEIESREIYFNKENAILFNQLLDEKQILQEERGVPTIIIGEKVLVGDKPIIANFENEANKYLQSEIQEKIETINNESKKSDLTILAVIIGALVDAINPCEFAVLIILMTTILMTGNSKRALLSGLAFSMSIFISYFLMGIGLYSALNLGNISQGFYKIVGWVAILLGVLNLKDYFWYGKGFLMEVPLSWRPRLKQLIQSVTSPKGAFLIGFVVSLFLLPCTSGPYIVILGMLAKKADSFQAIFYLIIYNLIFVSPMLFISYAVFKGYNPAKAEEIRQKRLRTLHLIAGFVMIIMGFVIVLELI